MPTTPRSSRRLYLFYIGGTAGRSNIEVHDVQFAAVKRIPDAYPSLRDAWFGDPSSLHLDGYAAVAWADGFDVTLAPAPDPSGWKLFFVNMGGYRRGVLAELHEFGLFVARDAAGAKTKARQHLLAGAEQLHKDDLREVDNCLLLAQVDGLFVHLSPNPHGTPMTLQWQGYRLIGREEDPRAGGLF